MVVEVLRRLALAGAAAVLFAVGARALPEGSVIDPPADRFPAQRLRAEQEGGRQSWLVALGNTAFSSPLLYGRAAREAGISCNACHVNGHVNQAFFIPGLSARPGGLDPTNGVFNPAADDGVSGHVDIPSLRGIRFLGPYGRDGRIGSLREFTRQVIVTEFGGPEPTPLMLDALVAYMSEFEFLPNPWLKPDGRLRPSAPEAARRGEAAFAAAPSAGGAACADCHRPGTAFTDSRAHDVGTGGRFRTPTLLDADSSAPYGHDGRWASYDAMLADGHGGALDPALRADIVAYLDAVGAADEPDEPAGFGREMAEVATYAGVLDGAIARGDAAIVRFVADTVRAELARLSRAFPEGDAERQRARPDRRKRPIDWVRLDRGLDDVARAAERGDAPAASRALDDYYATVESMAADYPRARR